jgi:hypothetical protein
MLQSMSSLVTNPDHEIQQEELRPVRTGPGWKPDFAGIKVIEGSTPG